MNPTSKFETISPEKAKLLLENNKNNRPVNEANLNFISSAMSKSKIIQPLESFFKRTDNKKLRASHCKNCLRIYAKLLYRRKCLGLIKK